MKNFRPFLSIAVSGALLGYGLTFGVAQKSGQSASSQKAKSAAKSKSAGVRVIDFNRDVRPILSDHCFKCHGPDAKEAKGGLRLSDGANAHQKRDGYSILDSKNVDDSELLQRVTANDTSQMPPKDSGMSKLSKEQISILRDWIKSGAKYERHWSFVQPKMPTIPVVKNQKWVRNPIDAFVLERLEAKGLKPEAEADKATLLRRASLTLTGLVPTEEERAMFEKDTKPGAYERAVDRLLASERYGEHQARFWLDAVRYGDTHGLHIDNERAIYPYRDWVVRAMNQDLPFNQFTEWQIAGDLMPNPSTEMKVATGYIRMNPTTNEGGAIEEEFLAKNTFDRVDTTSTVFLGMTTACAKCHDHKFDPISTKDYYSMYAFFNSTKDAPFDGNLLAPEPTIQVMLPEEQKQLEVARAKMKKMLESISVEKVEAWIKSRNPDPIEFSKWEVSEPMGTKTFDQGFDTEFTPKNWRPLALKIGTTIAVNGRENSAAYVRTTIKTKSAQEQLFGIGSDDGVKVWLNGKLIHSNRVLRGADQATDEVKASLVAGENNLVIKIINQGGPDGLRFNYGTAVDRALEAAGKNVELQKEVFVLNGEKAESAKEYKAAKELVTRITTSAPRTLIAEELPKPRETYVLRRGEYTLKGDKVERGVPAALGSIPKGAPMNRLGLAKWLTSQDNPLVGRVLVNRIWQQHFGTGLVKTAEDFGNQGDWPSHPELLDYLAVRFVNEGWSVKKVHKWIITSAAFRQKSTVTKQKLTVDPENRLVSRGPRFRLDAEVLRDQTLQVSGLLVNRKGGRGFRPYQPAGLWEEVGFDVSDTGRYTQDMDESIYRRTLYLFWKRTSPHPFMSSFDAPSREACVVRRPRTNTPLQALVTMNEPAFVESARVFAERAVQMEKDDAARVRRMFRTAIGRMPTEQEVSILLKSVKNYQAKFAKDSAGAESLSNFGLAKKKMGLDKKVVASYTVLASTIFNLDEYLTQH